MDETTKHDNFRAGQSVLCRIEKPEPGGYAVKLIPSDLDAFLPSRDELTIGTTVPATYVCMSNDRALMTFAFVIGTTERVQFGLPSEEETAFAVWTDSYPSNVKLRRAVDMIMPHITGKLAQIIQGREVSIETLLSDLETSRFTGCIKSESDEMLSRSAALLYRGRVVGCLYGRKSLQEPHLLSAALSLMIADLEADDASLLIYELPEEIVLSMSSLFIGCPVREDESISDNAAGYLEQIMPVLEANRETACITLAAEEKQSECLGFLYKGRKWGSFSIVDQQFEEDFDQVAKQAHENTSLLASAYLLPREMISDSVLLGYSLTSRKGDTE